MRNLLLSMSAFLMVELFATICKAEDYPLEYKYYRPSFVNNSISNNSNLYIYKNNDWQFNFGLESWRNKYNSDYGLYFQYAIREWNFCYSKIKINVGLSFPINYIEESKPEFSISYTIPKLGNEIGVYIPLDRNNRFPDSIQFQLGLLRLVF